MDSSTTPRRPFYTHEQADNEFGFHPATPEVGAVHDLIREGHRQLAHQLINVLPEGPLKTTAITTLRQAMWAANAAVATTTDQEWRDNIPHHIAHLATAEERAYWPVDPDADRQTRYASTDAGRALQERDLRLATITDDELAAIDRIRAAGGVKLSQDSAGLWAGLPEANAERQSGWVDGATGLVSGPLPEAGEQEGHANAA